MKKVLSPSEDTPEMSWESASLEAGAVGNVKGIWGRERGIEGNVMEKRGEQENK